MRPAILHQVTVLVHGAPQILALTVDRDEDFVQKPRISESTLTSLQPPGVIGAELPAPLPNSFVRHDDAAFRQEILDIPEAQAVSVIQPDGVADDFRRKAMPKVAGSSNVHPGIYGSARPKRSIETTRFLVAADPAAAAAGAAATAAGGGGGGGAAISIATMCVVSCGVGRAIRSDIEIKRKIETNAAACAADESSVVGTLERWLSGRSTCPATSLNIGPTAAFNGPVRAGTVSELAAALFWRCFDDRKGLCDAEKGI